MNIITQIATKLTSSPSCDFASESTALTCSNVGDLRTSLAKSVPLWKQAVIVFRVIAALFFLKQVFTIFKHLIAAAPLAAAKSAAYAAIGTFLLFDIGNTLYILVKFKDLIQAAVDTVIDITKTDTPNTR